MILKYLWSLLFINLITAHTLISSEQITYDEFGHNVLHRTARLPSADTLQNCLQKNPHLINDRTRTNATLQDPRAFFRTFGHIAAFYQKFNHIILWVAHGGDPTLRDVYGKNVYHENQDYHSKDLIRSAIEKGYKLRSDLPPNSPFYNPFTHPILV